MTRSLYQRVADTFVGLALIALYWWHIRPEGSGLGYSGDMCTDFVRQLMSEGLAKGHGPVFSSDQLMAPGGASIPFMSWSIERDWLGAYFWNWNPEFPFRWVFYGLSLAVTYLGVGWLLGKLRLGPRARWIAALVAVLLHAPRHYKTWYHYEHLPQHWVYLSFFLDAWIWQRLKREGKWSWELELWRIVLQLGAFTSTGYFWGVTSFEWIVVRLSILAVWVLARFRGRRFAQVDGNWKRALWAGAACLALITIEVRWFWPLYLEIRDLPRVQTLLGWFTSPLLIFMPLWRPEWLQFPKLLPPMDRPETVITIGWYLIAPLVLSWSVIRKRAGGPGVGVILPFAIFSFCGVLYLCDGFPIFLQQLLPFMNFFRVASRWGLFFPQLASVMIVLAWPELKRSVLSLGAKPWGRAVFLAFAISSLLELQWLLLPVVAMPELPARAGQMMQAVAASPGDTVLDLPFCVAGGNGLCTEEQCPGYPRSISGICLRQWHHKKVYGIYHPRMLESQCDYYRKPPFQAWVKAWREKRCFNPSEWGQFCEYLDSRTDLSAVLLYPEIWEGSAAPDCQAQFSERLGPPLDQALIDTIGTRDGKGTEPTRILRFGTRCRKP